MQSPLNNESEKNEEKNENDKIQSKPTLPDSWLQPLHKNYKHWAIKCNQYKHHLKCKYCCDPKRLFEQNCESNDKESDFMMI